MKETLTDSRMEMGEISIHPYDHPEDEKQIYEDAIKRFESRPNIGIPAFGVKGNFGITMPYYEYLSKFGNVILLPPGDFNPSIDLLVLSGGPDINPSRYGAVPSFSTGYPCPIREYFDVNILPLYLAKRTPTFGICRGHQSLAVHFGANLVQHMYHETNEPNKRWETVHSVVFDHSRREFPHGIKVNSIHHQVVEKRSAEQAGIIVDAVYDVKKGKHQYADVESCIYNESTASVQWHPEEIQDEYSEYIIKKLILREPLV